MLDEGRGLTAHHAVRIVAMTASSLHYQGTSDRNVALRSSILSLAHHYRPDRAGRVISSCVNAAVWPITSF